MLKTVNGRWGKCTYFAKDEYVGRSIHNYGEYNPDETEMILSLADDGGSSFRDIGANIGCISQALVASGFSGCAYEPQPEVFKVLEQNLSSVDGVQFCTCINAGVGSVIGSAEMPRVHYSEKGNFGGLSIGTTSHLGHYTVPIVTIDDKLYKMRIGFMKIDVEGYELQVLQGAERTIRSHKPIMYIEDDRPEKSKKLREFISYLGYSITEHKPALYREDNFFGLKRNIWDKNYASHNLICRPC